MSCQIREIILLQFVNKIDLQFCKKNNFFGGVYYFNFSIRYLPSLRAHGIGA